MAHEDEDLWAFVTADIEPLEKKPAPQKAPSPPEEKKAAPAPEVTEKVEPPALKTPKATRKKPVGKDLDKKTEERFLKGELPIEGTIDLHGMRQEEAHKALIRFIGDAIKSGKRTVLVITGIGARSINPEHWLEDQRGVLREKLPEWLAASPLDHNILRHVQARPKHGGAGAFYVYLRRQRH
jgi:DNA-nicking Smr family endonuclease